jgi:hypothetical protein
VLLLVESSGPVHNNRDRRIRGILHRRVHEKTLTVRWDSWRVAAGVPNLCFYFSGYAVIRQLNLEKNIKSRLQKWPSRDLGERSELTTWQEPTSKERG